MSIFDSHSEKLSFPRGRAAPDGIVRLDSPFISCDWRYLEVELQTKLYLNLPEPAVS